MGLTPSELKQCLRPPSDMVQVGVKKTVDCRVNSDVNVGGGEGVVSGVSTYCGAGMAWLRIVAVFLIAFCISSPNYR